MVTKVIKRLRKPIALIMVMAMTLVPLTAPTNSRAAGTYDTTPAYWVNFANKTVKVENNGYVSASGNNVVSSNFDLRLTGGSDNGSDKGFFESGGTTDRVLTAQNANGPITLQGPFKIDVAIKARDITSSRTQARLFVRNGSTPLHTFITTSESLETQSYEYNGSDAVNLVFVPTYSSGSDERLQLHSIDIYLPTSTAPPAAPTAVHIQGSSDGTAQLSWTAVPGATSYTVTAKSGGSTITGLTYAAFGGTDTTRTITAGLVNGRTYTFDVKAKNAAGESAATSSPSFTPALPAPAGFTATDGEGSVTLSWTTVTGATGYKLERKLSSASDSTFTVVAAGLAPTATGYTDSISPGRYTYRLTPFNHAGDSNAAAKTASGQSTQPGTAPTAAPDRFTAAATGTSGQIVLTWNPVQGASGYRIYTGAGDITGVDAGNSLTYMKSGLTDGVAYTFYIAAYNIVGISSNRASATATPTQTVSSNFLNLQGKAWFESASATWNAGSYSHFHVYYKQSSQPNSAWVKVDEELVRGTRADIIGMKHSTPHDIKVVAVTGNTEVSATESIITNMVPQAYDRSGAAFSRLSPLGAANGNIPGGTTWSVGAYNADGTLKSNAVVVYVTNDTADTFSTGALTGKDGRQYSFTGLSSSGDSSIFKTGSESPFTKRIDRPLVIRFVGQVGESLFTNGRLPASGLPGGLTSLAMMDIKQAKHITLEGVGSDAVIYGWGLNINRSQNIEVRNLKFDKAWEDMVSVEGASGTMCTNIWIHNNIFTYGQDQAIHGGDADKAKGDGATDTKYASFYTISYNHYIESSKTNLAGATKSEPSGWYGTYHHNWYENTGSRGPRVRKGMADVYNNYYSGVSTYAIGAGLNANILAEANYFENVNRPMIMSGQGHSLQNFTGTGQVGGSGSDTLSGEGGGTIKLGALPNMMVNVTNYDPSWDTGTVAKSDGYTFTPWDLSAYPRQITDAAKAREDTVAYSGVTPASIR